jgi:hypothetical protein
VNIFLDRFSQGGASRTKLTLGYFPRPRWGRHNAALRAENWSKDSIKKNADSGANQVT